MNYFIYVIAIFLFFSACQSSSEKNMDTIPLLKEIDFPCKEGGEPNLFTSKNGQIYISWVEYLNDTTNALLFSKLEDNHWSTPQTIATGSNWFVNWADFPSIVAYDDSNQSLAAHWLQKSAKGTFDYDVRITQSFDAGQTWTPSFIPHRDSISAEHGFVSLVPLSGNRIFTTWLDGRNTKEEGHEKGKHGHHGAMSLRVATFDKNGNLYDEAELDNRVCDCCQTSAALTDKGIIIAYRDRSEEEVRDITIIRQIDGEWTTPRPIFKDNWRIAGCPVNGASIKANGKNVAIAWFSMPNEKPEVKVAFSEDSGATFCQPIRIDNGNPLGRVDIVLLPNNEAVVSWLEKTDENGAIKAVKVNAKGKISPDFVITNTDISRQSGFPKMIKTGNQILFTWTNVSEVTKVKSGVVDIEKW